MTEAASPQDDAQDSAWASIITPLAPATLLAFCEDIERLFRINPLLEFERWEQTGADSYHFKGRNLSQDPPFDIDTDLRVDKQADGMLIRYSSGLKSDTRVRVEAEPNGSKLTIIDNYSGSSEDERRERLNEVDKSLVPWARYLQEFLVSWRRWSWLAPWRWYMRRVWQPMKPSGRRIAYMLLWITLVEVVVIIAIAIFLWRYFN
jgi:hypothetical protein